MVRPRFWYPIKLHFGEQTVDAIACTNKKHYYAHGDSFGYALRKDQYKDSGNPVWWEKTGISERTQKLVPHGDKLKEWDE